MTSIHPTRTAIARACALSLALSITSCAAESGPALDAATRQSIVDAAVAQLDRGYVFPDKARAIGADLRARLVHGDFDGMGGERFADALTRALRETSHDGHLEVRYMGNAPPPAQGATGADPELLQQRRLNYGVARVERLKGNIGYIDMHEFGRPRGAAPRIRAALDLLADTDAMVVDLRKCGGGDPETVMAFASYFYDRPTHLNDVYWRDENRLEARWTTAQVDGQRYGGRRPLYLLTSPDTFSGCEDLAYAMKNNHRAVVVGETTGGGAHAGSPQPLAAHFMMFVPSGRPINPVTHTDWEGVGVAPDQPTSADAALDAAQVAALTALASKESDARWKAQLEQRLAELK